jgi:hypothetical protein
MEYYEILTAETSKPLFSKENYSCFNTINESYKTLAKCKEVLKDKYGKCKKQKMYCDRKDGSTYQRGWIYSFKNRDISHNSNTWLQQDWVEIRKVKSDIIL